MSSPTKPEELKFLADVSWEQISTWASALGPDAFILIQKFVDRGFSLKWVEEAIGRLGPDLLRFLADWVEKTFDPDGSVKQEFFWNLPVELGGAALQFILTHYGKEIISALIPDHLENQILEYIKLNFGDDAIDFSGPFFDIVVQFIFRKLMTA